MAKFELSLNKHKRINHNFPLTNPNYCYGQTGARKLVEETQNWLRFFNIGNGQ